MSNTIYTAMLNRPKMANGKYYHAGMHPLKSKEDLEEFKDIADNKEGIKELLSKKTTKKSGGGNAKK